jgi:hypothetical protein
MFPNANLFYIFGPAIVLASIVLAILKKERQNQSTSELGKAIEHFKLTSILFGVLLLILWLSLPQAPVLKSFGYPDDVSVLKDESKTLNLLQTYNKALVRTTEVLYWFLFLFIWWFMTTLFGIAKAYKVGSDKNFAQQVAL